jgi:serine protease Do
VNQVIARGSGSVVFVQGSCGFEDLATRRPLRIAVDKRGQALRTPDGRQVVTLEGGGPPVRMRISGTAFVVDAQGLLLTNRHVALPWENEAMLPALREIGLEPVMLAMRGYSPGVPEPFDVSFLAASDTHDVAVLQGRRVPRSDRRRWRCRTLRHHPATRPSCWAIRPDCAPRWRGRAMPSSSD